MRRKCNRAPGLIPTSEKFLSKSIHILGICGTFMGGLALLARELGFEVSGSDQQVYPPMSTQLREAGITLHEGYGPGALTQAPDLVVIGNALSRGNEAVEAVLNGGLRYQSGPQWLGDTLLADRHVLAVSGTHGKTSTSSMLAHILDHAGLAPGFLIGGVPLNFGISARSGGGRYFVVEADEYDTAFFDKRSKFVHYRPNTLVIGNLEYDHADIFPDLAAIETQFHHLVRCVPGQGRVLYGPAEAIGRVLDRGCWSERASLAVGAEGDWRIDPLTPAGQRFRIEGPGGVSGEGQWSMLGQHNLANALAAVAAAADVGVTLPQALAALADYWGVKRRLELRGKPGNVAVYDDFAHHPTAIQTTLESLRLADMGGRTWAVIEPRSNTMRGGYHRAALIDAVSDADRVLWYQPPGLNWALDSLVTDSPVPAEVHSNIEHLVAALTLETEPGDRIVIMSNGGFDGIHEKLLLALENRYGAQAPTRERP